MKKYDLKNKETIKKASKENQYNGYYEIPYTEYREDGTIKCTGTEDFSGERYRNLVNRSAYKKTGNKNKGGHDIWKKVGSIICDSTVTARKLLTLEYGKDIAIRKY